MNYEKRYRALVRAIQELQEVNPSDEGLHNWIIDNVPELKENKDEGIRKAIISIVAFSPEVMFDRVLVTRENCLAWLEKQGNKPQGKSTLETVKDEKVENANKVKPKFEFDIDDWVVTDKGDTVQIVAVNNSNYTLYNRMKFDISYVDKFWHKWTIKDAKEGDVLCDYNNIYDNPLIFILKKFECVDFGLVRPSDYSSYCFITTGHRQIFKKGTYHHKNNIKPATKAQRDLLFSKMKEAGYEWDEEKLELKKITNDNEL